MVIAGPLGLLDGMGRGGLVLLGGGESGDLADGYGLTRDGTTRHG